MKIFLHNITNITNVYSYINSLKIKKKKKKIKYHHFNKEIKIIYKIKNTT